VCRAPKQALVRRFCLRQRALRPAQRCQVIGDHGPDMALATMRKVTGSVPVAITWLQTSCDLAQRPPTNGRIRQPGRPLDAGNANRKQRPLAPEAGRPHARGQLVEQRDQRSRLGTELGLTSTLSPSAGSPHARSQNSLSSMLWENENFASWSFFVILFIVLFWRHGIRPRRIAIARDRSRLND
jgi:hypothetical protein